MRKNNVDVRVLSKSEREVLYKLVDDAIMQETFISGESLKPSEIRDLTGIHDLLYLCKYNH